MLTRPVYEFPELPVLHGAALARLTDDEFFELCQANPTLSFKRNFHQKTIRIPPPAPNRVKQAWKVRTSFGSATAKPS